MTVTTDAELYRRGAVTLLDSWEEYCRGSDGALLERSPGVGSAVFPDEPERGVYNNAPVERDRGPAERDDALNLMEVRMRPPASGTLLLGSTRVTSPCVSTSNAAATNSIRRRVRWAWCSTTSDCRARRWSWRSCRGRITCARLNFRPDFSAAVTIPRFASWSRSSTGSQWQPRWPSTLGATAGSTTWRPSRTRDAAGSERP